MTNEVIGGIVRNGVVVPDSPLPEGVRVDMTISTREVVVPPELQAEFDAWNQLSDRALIEFEKVL
jgi:predicted RNA-binding protein (virulence factor B family)